MLLSLVSSCLAPVSPSSTPDLSFNGDVTNHGLIFAFTGGAQTYTLTVLSRHLARFVVSIDWCVDGSAWTDDMLHTAVSATTEVTFEGQSFKLSSSNSTLPSSVLAVATDNSIISADGTCARSSWSSSFLPDTVERFYFTDVVVKIIPQNVLGTADSAGLLYIPLSTSYIAMVQVPNGVLFTPLSSSLLELGDVTPPTITECPSNVNASAEPGTAEVTITWSAPNATDNSGVVTWLQYPDTLQNVTVQGSPHQFTVFILYLRMIDAIITCFRSSVLGIRRIRQPSHVQLLR